MMHGKKFVAGGESEEADDDGREEGGSARARLQASRRYRRNGQLGILIWSN